jgi:threonine/homoserine/homoserine lactone efflux protein
MGIAVYAANPKNLTLGIAAGVALGAEPLPVGQSVLVGILYVFVAASTVVLPTIAYFAAPARIRPWLDELRQWLAQHNAALMAVLLAVIGTNMFGKGLSSLG